MLQHLINCFVIEIKSSQDDRVNVSREALWLHLEPNPFYMVFQQLSEYTKRD